MRSTATLPCALAVVLCLASCARGPELRPAAAAERVGGHDTIATAEGSGVRVVIDTDAWRRAPPDLGPILPIRISFVNGSGHALRLRYDEFALVRRDGKRLTALPPLSVHDTEGESTVVTTYDPTFAWRGAFYVASPYEPYYKREASAWQGPFNVDPYYYRTHYAEWPAHLPSTDMVQEGLPEGVLGQGATLTGFLYFRDETEQDQYVIFRTQLVDARTATTFGDVDIPLMHR